MSYVDGPIEVLSSVEAIRRRPEMYVGQCDDSTLFNRFIQETLCLAVDEAVSGFCTQVRVSVFADGHVVVRDNGGGLCMMPNVAGLILAEALFSKLHACRESKRNSAARLSCCEMDIVVVNALSEWFLVRNFHEGGCWVQEYRHGEALASFQREAETTETGLELAFKPDPSFLRNLYFDAPKLIDWVRGTKAGFDQPTITNGYESGEPTILLFEKRKQALR